jgi:hypothetical protein
MVGRDEPAPSEVERVEPRSYPGTTTKAVETASQRNGLVPPA